MCGASLLVIELLLYYLVNVLIAMDGFIASS